MTDKKEKQSYRRVNEDTYERVAAEKQAELEATRKRMAELRALRVSQEARGRAPVKTTKARIARSATKQSLADWLSDQDKSGRKT